MVHLSYKEIKQSIRPVVSNATLEDLAHRWRARGRRLWGANKHANPLEWLKRALVLALYHDIVGIGYTALSNAIRDWLVITPKSLAHNTKMIRKWGARLAGKKIVLGNFKQRHKRAKRVPKAPPLKRVTLWLDSVDLPLSRKGSVRRLNRIYLKSNFFQTAEKDQPQG